MEKKQDELTEKSSKTAMEPIVITFDSQHGFNVKQGDKYADRLCYDEMMGLLSSLTMPKERPCLQWMRTEEEHKAFYGLIGDVNFED